MATYFLLVCPVAKAGEIQELYHASGNVVEQESERRFGDATTHGITEIGIERTVCFGACPAYTFIAKSDGTFRYSGEDFVERKGTSTGTVSIHDFSLLAQFIRDSGYMELADRYQQLCQCGPEGTVGNRGAHRRSARQSELELMPTPSTSRFNRGYLCQEPSLKA